MKEFAVLLLGFGVVACNRPEEESVGNSSKQGADTPAASTPVSEPRRTEPQRASDSTAGLARGVEPGTIPATPTPTVTTDASLAAMRAHLQRLEPASGQELQGRMAEHSKMLSDLLTTMRVEVQATTSPRKESWIAAADTVEGDLSKLVLSRGAELQTAFRAHRTRVLRLLEDFRALVPSGRSS